MQPRFPGDGIEVFPGIVSGPAVAGLAGRPEFVVPAKPGSRSFTVDGEIARLIAPDGALGQLAMRLAGGAARPVRVLFFDKSPGANWAVPWHQDRTIAVKSRRDVEDFGPWSVKAGVPHVEPPAKFLAAMVALRLHLDDCGAENGPLQAIRGSYRLGRLTDAGIKACVAAGEPVMLTAAAGDTVAMRGLTVHASARAERPAHRRVIHVDYAPDGLPGGLEWALERTA